MGWRPKKRAVSYIMEMLKHRFNTNAFLGSLAVSLVMTIPWGMAGILPFIGYLAALTMAILTVPDHHKWREAVDTRIDRDQREAAREHLVSEIKKRVGDNHAYWTNYYRMLERRDSLAKMAAESDTAITLDDIKGLDESTVDYLGLWLARIAIHERGEAVDQRALRGRVMDLGHKLEKDLPSADKRRLQKAKSDIENLLRRHEEMVSRDAALEANMLSMADTFDEVYQRIIANPTAREAFASELQVAVARMDAEEDMDYELEEQFDALDDLMENE
ncbi:MAG: hypothetical protein ACI9KE_003377 [Polyangiales bacterium]|jgi:hypothetical protein